MHIKKLLVKEWHHLARINHSDRPWEMPAAAALASGLPVFIGVAMDALRLGLTASIGAMVFLYMPTKPLAQRMTWMAVCVCAMTLCYGLGIAAHLSQMVALPILVCTTFLVMLACRYYSVAPPGGLFFVMAAAIGAFSPITADKALAQIGAVAMGGLLAVAIAWAYSLRMSRQVSATISAPPRRSSRQDVVMDATVIAVFVGFALLAAQVLDLQRPYWVPVSCLAVIQGASLRIAWTRQLQRILGTAVGLLLFWGIAHLALGPWGIACVLTVQVFAIETLVVRHYGLAAVFITPMAIMMAEAAQSGTLDPYTLMHARLEDTILGAGLGVVGAACLHSPRFRHQAGRLVQCFAWR